MTQPAPSRRPAIETIRVLVVEDSPDHRMLIARALRGSGYDVVAVATGEDALAHLTEVDVVLLDQRLPRMSGTELLGEVVALPDAPAPVVVTGTDSQDLVVEALRLGAVDYVVKTSSYLAELPAVVARAHRQHDLARRYRELQRFALLVHAPTDRADAVHEIVTGGRRLLGADGVALLQRQEDDADQGWQVAARDGRVGDLAGVRQWLDTPEGTTTLREDLTVVELPRRRGESSAALVLARGVRGPFDDEEVELATTFAALAASALRQVHRLELERGLIEQLREAVRERQDFLASVSHELRTPLTVIAGYVQTLLHRSDAIPAEEHHRILGRVKSNADALGQLIDQLLDVAAIERGRGSANDPRELDLAGVVRRAVDEVDFHLDQRPGTRDVSPVSVLADPELLRLTLVNLLSNACKYSSPGSPVELRADVEADRVRVEVTDHGVGVEPEDVDRVFDPFWRAGHAVAGAIRGTGIGLSLVREYVTVMGGQVGVQSPPGDGEAFGSTFWFTVPRAAVGGSSPSGATIDRADPDEDRPWMPGS